LPLTSSVIDKYRHNDWNTKHNYVTISALGRLFIPNVLPKGHKRILYLDGDTFIAADPSPLIDYSAPEGRFAAVEDIIYFRRNDFTKLGKFTREYLRGIGVNGNNGYFNSGMFIVGIDTCRSLAQEALLFFENNTKACLYHDQSALNAVVGNRRIRLSLAWNFQTPYRYWNIEKEIVPRIYHFTQFPARLS
jgi:lipopolysaccharide biosynthesis glycosyltransferase